MGTSVYTLINADDPATIVRLLPLTVLYIIRFCYLLQNTEIARVLAIIRSDPDKRRDGLIDIYRLYFDRFFLLLFLSCDRSNLRRSPL